MKVLIAEDSITLLLTTSKIVETAGHEVIQARDGKEALELFDSEKPDLVLLDVEMPGHDGFEVAKKIRSKKLDYWIPIIFLTGYVEDQYLLQGIEAGGDDYLTKPVSNLVLNAKLNAMQRIYEMQRELVQISKQLSETNEKLNQSIITDPLTGANNRLYLDECLNKEWFRCMRNKKYLSALIIDVDNFKILNDTQGHHAGDKCLIELVKIFQSHLKRSADVICRHGGDEFVILLPETSQKDAMNIAEKIRESVIEYSNHTKSKTLVDISVSIGCASCIPDDKYIIDKLLIVADKALYESKNAGRNCVTSKELNYREDEAA